jgi:hypothetical protein
MNDTGKCECSLPFFGHRCTEEAFCKYWNYATESWSTDGCVVAGISRTSIVCKCTHLTDFASFSEEFLPQPNLINPFDGEILSAFFSDPRNMVVLVLIASVYFLYSISVCYGWSMDRAERHEHYMERVVTLDLKPYEPPEDASKNSAYSGPHVGKATMLAMAQLHLSPGVNNRNSRYRNVVKKRTCCSFFSSCFKSCRESAASLGPKFKKSIQTNHSWIACIFVNAEDEFTRPQRVTVLMSVVMGTIFIASLFFEGPRCMPADEGYPDCPNDEEDVDFDFRKAFITALIVALLMMPCDVMFVSLFRRVKVEAPEKKGVGPGGRIWALPASGLKATTAVKIQSRIRGLLSKRRTDRKKAENVTADDKSKIARMGRTGRRAAVADVDEIARAAAAFDGGNPAVVSNIKSPSIFESKPTPTGSSGVQRAEGKNRTVPSTPLGRFVETHCKTYKLDRITTSPYLGASELAKQTWAALMKSWEKEQEKDCRPAADGRLTVTVARARNLIAADSNGLSDPYVVLRLGARSKKRTKVVSKSLNPEFGETFQFPISAAGGVDDFTLTLTVKDKDVIGKDDYLGHVELHLGQIFGEHWEGPAVHRRWKLSGDNFVATGSRGDIELRLQFVAAAGVAHPAANAPKKQPPPPKVDRALGRPPAWFIDLCSDARPAAPPPPGAEPSPSWGGRSRVYEGVGTPARLEGMTMVPVADQETLAQQVVDAAERSKVSTSAAHGVHAKSFKQPAAALRRDPKAVAAQMAARSAHMLELGPPDPSGRGSPAAQQTRRPAQLAQLADAGRGPAKSRRSGGAFTAIADELDTVQSMRSGLQDQEKKLRGKMLEGFYVDSVAAIHAQTYAEEQGEAPLDSQVGLDRIVALYCRSSTLYHIH